MVLIDVVIPVYNTPLPVFEQAVRSVICQTLTRWRAIVVDDESKPEVSAEIENFLAALGDSRIDYHRIENGGVAAARNHGIRTSVSPYVALLDSDDIWHPRKLQSQFTVLDSMPDVAVVHTAYANFHDGDPGRLIPARLGLDRLNQLSPEEACVAMLRRNFVGASTAVLRRSACEESGYFDTAFRTLEDKELWVRLLMRERRFHHLSEVLMYYRMHAGNISKNTDAMLRGRRALIAKVDRAADEAPPWFGRIWPSLKREMCRNAHIEAAEAMLDSGQYSRALAACSPWRCGVGRRVGRVVFRSLLGLADRPQ
jgi:glycosyltransferase involved in cell wall biosynthesis